MAKQKKSNELQVDRDPPAHQTVIRVSRTTKLANGKTSEENEEEFLDVHKFQTTPAVVSVSLGGTVNLGNYQSSKFNVMISRPCYNEEIDEAFEEIKADALIKAMDVISEYRQARG